jgi:ABC-type glycerol-3-phosphate transport system substrate-binding protein
VVDLRLLALLQSFGGDLIDRNTYKTASGVLNGDKALAWANWFQGLIRNKYPPAKSDADAFADFVNGKSAMVWSGIWNAGNLEKVKDGVVMRLRTSARARRSAVAPGSGRSAPAAATRPARWSTSSSP